MYIESPLIESRFFPEQYNVFLKLENTQPSGSFKSRGMSAIVEKAIARQPNAHFFSSSGGNAGLAVAEAAAGAGAKCTVLLPNSTPKSVLERLKRFGAEPVVHGEVWSEANDYLVTEILPKHQPHGVFCHPFDDQVAWDGHSTMVDELVEQLNGKKPGSIVLSVGGGGLLLGVLRGLERHGWTKDVKVYAVETEHANCLHEAIEAGHPVNTTPHSIAKSLGASRAADKAVEYALKYKVQSVLVSDEEAAAACRQFAADHCMIVEPACGATLAAIYKAKISTGANKDVVAIVCGGSLWSVLDLEKEIDASILRKAVF